MIRSRSITFPEAPPTIISEVLRKGILHSQVSTEPCWL